MVLNTFLCPSDDKDSPVYAQALDYGVTTVSSVYPVPSPTGVKGALAAAGNMTTFNGLFGGLDYILCSGISDALCFESNVVPAWERGMFSFNLQCPAQAVTDGLSNTFMMGEGAQGSKFPLKLSNANATPNPNTYPIWAWIAGEVNTVSFNVLAGGTFYVGGPFGTTVMPLNQNPVLQTLCNDAAVSILSNNKACNSTASTSPAGHLMSGFRSAHTGGANFLLADGAVRFIQESVDCANQGYGYKPINPPSGITTVALTGGSYPNFTLNPATGLVGVYQALSTRAGGEAVGVP
jgi:prepilin-type processing-associated H-X9-DG protein